MERDRYAIGKIKEYIISTHTLTWSVTISADVKIVNIFISTHTLTWSVTQNLLAHINNVFISTHTLTWSVTVLYQTTEKLQGFQLTRSRGAWPFKWKNLCGVWAFQLTRSRGAWLECLYDEWILCISTHTLTWSVTRINSVKLNRLAISTHTLTWSVTGLSKLCVIHCHFNSHAHVERDFFKATLNGKSRISTHTLTWSVTSDPESRPCPYG